MQSDAVAHWAKPEIHDPLMMMIPLMDLWRPLKMTEALIPSRILDRPVPIPYKRNNPLQPTVLQVQVKMLDNTSPAWNLMTSTGVRHY